MKEYFKNWDFIRVIRLILGILMIIQGVHTDDLMFISLGLLFSLMSVFNIGCCTSGKCQIAVRKNTEDNTMENITFKEIK